MTIITWDTKKLVTDSQGSNQGTIVGPFEKLHCFDSPDGPAVVAFCGHLPGTRSVLEWLKNHTSANGPKYPELPDNWSITAVVWSPNSKTPLVEYHQGHKIVFKENHAHAWGSGMDFALGCFFAQEIPEALEAAQAACACDESCGGPLVNAKYNFENKYFEIT